jgi:DNA modification methylase
VIHYEGHGVQVHHGDCLDVLRELPDCSVDSVVTDPPYALGFMGRSWDTFGEDVGRGAQARAQRAAEVTPIGEGHTTSAGPYLASGVDSLRAAGQPFQRWCEQWAAECLRVLKPGGHLLAFGGSRTYHRLTSGVEDAGFEIRDCITWHFGSGFPKSLDVSKAIDRARGDGPATLGVTTWLRDQVKAAGLTRAEVMERGPFTEGQLVHWLAGTPLVGPGVPSWEQWERLREVIGFGEAMDAEVWRLNGRKGTPGEAWHAREVLGMSDELLGRRSGIGNGTEGHHTVGGTRAEAYTVTAPATPDAQRWQGWGTALKPATEFIVVARKPLTGTVAATVLEHGTGALNIDACRVEGDVPSVPQPNLRGESGHYGSSAGRIGEMSSAPGGRWPANVVFDEHQAAVLDEMSGERPSGKPQNRYTSGDKFGGTPYGEGLEQRTGWATSPGYVDDGGASRFFYVAKADATERPRVNGTSHPTVKPLALMRWLTRLVCPPGGTVLEPFAGSGTTVEACIVEGFRCIAIEKTDEYLPLIMARIHRRRDPVEAIKLAGEELGLFDLDGLGA